MNLRVSFFFFLIMLSITIFSQVSGSGKSLQFDGASHVTINNILADFGNEFSVEAWVKLYEGIDEKSVFLSLASPNGNEVLWLYIGPNSVGYVSEGLTNQNSKVLEFPFVDDIRGDWIHVGIIASNGTLHVSINGSEPSGYVSGASNNYQIPNGQIHFGSVDTEEGVQYFNGELDEIRIWNYARSYYDIRVAMCQSVEKTDSRLISYWRFDNDDNSIIDLVNQVTGVSNVTIPKTTSGAPIGDESFAILSPLPIKFFYNNYEYEFWITSNDPEWQGGHVYKVNSVPSSVQNSLISFDNGYFGFFPLPFQGKKVAYRIDLISDSSCLPSVFRNGNSDPIWQPISSETDTSKYFTSLFISEFMFGEDGVLENIPNEFVLCAGGQITIEDGSTCVTDYLWYNGSKNSEIIVNEPGEYWVERIVDNAIFRSKFSVILGIEPDLISFNSLQLCKSDLPFKVEVEFDGETLWKNGSTDNTLEVSASGNYWIEYNWLCGVKREEFEVNIEQLSDFFIPNAFTPNSDGINDCFSVSESLLGSELKVVNRSGVQIFYSRNYQNNWCDSSLSSGTFFYSISNVCLDFTAKGWVVLLK